MKMRRTLLLRVIIIQSRHTELSCKVDFYVVRSALPSSVCLLSVYFCWSGSSIDPTFAAYSFVVLCSLNVNYYTAFCGLCHEQGSISE